MKDPQETMVFHREWYTYLHIPLGPNLGDVKKAGKSSNYCWRIQTSQVWWPFRNIPLSHKIPIKSHRYSHKISMKFCSFSLFPIFSRRELTAGCTFWIRRCVAKKLGLPIVARFRSFACVAWDDKWWQVMTSRASADGDVSRVMDIWWSLDPE